MFSTKQYNAIAKVINEQRKVAEHQGGTTAIDDVIYGLSLLFKEDNPGFKPQTFCEKCGVPKLRCARWVG